MATSFGRGADRRRDDASSDASAAATRPTRRLRARPRARLGGLGAAVTAPSAERRPPVQMRWRTSRARPRQPRRRPHLPRGGPRRFARRRDRRDEYVVGRCSVNSRRDRSRRGRSPSVRVRELGRERDHDERILDDGASSSRPSSGSCSGTRQRARGRSPSERAALALGGGRDEPGTPIRWSSRARSPAPTSSARTTRTSPTRPRRSPTRAIEAATAGATGRPPARARGRRHPERPPGAVRRRDRPDPRRLRPC